MGQPTEVEDSVADHPAESKRKWYGAHCQIAALSGLMPNVGGPRAWAGSVYWRASCIIQSCCTAPRHGFPFFPMTSMTSTDGGKMDPDARWSGATREQWTRLDPLGEQDSRGNGLQPHAIHDWIRLSPSFSQLNQSPPPPVGRVVHSGRSRWGGRRRAPHTRPLRSVWQRTGAHHPGDQSIQPRWTGPLNPGNSGAVSRYTLDARDNPVRG